MAQFQDVGNGRVGNVRSTFRAMVKGFRLCCRRARRVGNVSRCDDLDCEDDGLGLTRLDVV